MDKATNIFSRVDDACSKFSTATLINATYSHNSYPKSDKENEDRSCHLLDDDFKTLAVLDGHKGSSCVTNACDSIANFFFSNNWKNIISRGKEQHILLKLKELIKETEIEFIERIQLYIDEVEALKLRIPSVSDTISLHSSQYSFFFNLWHIINYIIFIMGLITFSTATKHAFLYIGL